MNIAVIDVAAESGGALSVLNDFCSALKKSESKHEWYVITSVVEIEANRNIHNIVMPGIKKSWIHRILWEKIFLPKLMKKLQIDVVVSLQNNAFVKGRWRQAVFFHNVLLLKQDYSFSFIKKTERLYAIYTKILGPYTRYTWKNVSKFFVQTETVKEKIGEVTRNVDIEVIEPDVFVQRKNEIKCEKIKGYVYPATANTYKNHMAIINAVKELNDKKIVPDILFTIDGTENEYAAKIVQEASRVKGIRCIGMQTRENLFNLYAQYGVLMTSQIESLGVPLIEAKCFQTVAVALDYSYAKEALKGYNRAYLATEKTLVEALICGLNDKSVGNYVKDKNNSWERMIHSIEEMG